MDVIVSGGGVHAYFPDVISVKISPFGKLSIEEKDLVREHLGDRYDNHDMQILFIDEEPAYKWRYGDKEVNIVENWEQSIKTKII